MKISKSKRQLAHLLIEAGVTQFPEGANWAAQDRDKSALDSSPLNVMFYSTKPARPIRKGDGYWFATVSLSELVGKPVQLSTLIPNWHQTVLSRDEFDQIVAETAPDADGWVEWGGAPRSPVSKGTQVDVKMQNGTQHFGQLIDDECWYDCCGDANIIAYRLHKPELIETVEYNYSGVVYTGPVKSEFVVNEKPTLDQLLQDWRNADDFAKRKQAEADEAAAMRNERWEAVQARAGEMGVTIGACDSVVSEHKLEITDWRDLQVGDEVEVFNFERPESESRRKRELMSGPCVVMQVEGGNVRIELKKNLPTKGSHWNATGIDACEFKFIRRP